MTKVDCVFVGSEAVLENGGIVNRIGTFTIALCAKAYNKPFYVFAESLKFLKRFPLQQSDVLALLDDDIDDKHKTDESNTLVDYTSPEYISALFTDMGIFTPAAVSDQLIQYFQS
jgi:translation initiation factor eIF-2B subunit alpha